MTSTLAKPNQRFSGHRYARLLTHGCLLSWASFVVMACCATAPAVDSSATAEATATKTATTHDKKAATKDINARFVDPAMDPKSWVERFEREQREVYAHRTDVVAAIGIPPGAIIVDVGAGTGAYTEAFSKAVGPAGKVIALDIAPRFIDHLKAKVATAGWTNVSVHRSEPDDIKVPEATADIIFVCDTYHHFDSPDAVLATIRAALKPGGRLVIIDFHRIEGKTRPWLMEHVRAGQEVFAREIAAAGLVRLPDPPHAFLEENYMMVFKRP